ncbi:MAG: hypothetical protein GWM90_00100 [Gemmatimonadetes bacterium]|nr:hypothetical protein [Gemmatimonadota bacterium]NIQ51922.1 hypothetical protein [Gemmatimonadota bacterium]NIU72029.1 hypothetical protein [Gammaproteobacteria bacterium]NIX42591.1 hypothetical protein [Gemmatimonadota bacterium]
MERPLILVLGGAETVEVIDPAVADLNVQVERLEDCDGLEATPRTRKAAVVIVDAACAGSPEVLAEWNHGEAFDAAVPLLVFAPRPVEPAAYREWLTAGAWEVVGLPVDPALLGLRLRNMLGRRWAQLGAGLSITPSGPYPWPTLVRATGEVLALARRHGRDVACSAVSVERSGEGDAEQAADLMHRLGTTAREWVRRSDLVGLSEHDVLLVVLPDTTEANARLLTPRLVVALERALRRAGTVARLRTGVRGADPDKSTSAADFLLATIRRIG